MTGKPDLLQSMGLQRVRHDLANEQQPPQHQQGPTQVLPPLQEVLFDSFSSPVNLLSSLSLRVMVYLHHSVLYHINYTLPLLASPSSVRGSFVTPIWL